MVSPEQIQRVIASYTRTCLNDTFFVAFYDHFLAQSDEIAIMFRHTDWSRQLHLIKQAVRSAILYAKEPDMPIVHQFMERIAYSHSAEHRNVRPELYSFWLDSIVSTIRTHDPEYTPTLDKDWADVLMPAIRFITSHYDPEGHHT